MSLKLINKDNYLTSINNSVGTKIFKNLWGEIDGIKKDILEDGNLSCAQFVSGILFLNKMISERHATVSGTVKDLEEFGWKKIQEPKAGAILVWEKVMYPDDTEHMHIGFYIGEKLAISNSPAEKSPQIHHWTYGEEPEKSYRKVTAIYWHEALD